MDSMVLSSLDGDEMEWHRIKREAEFPGQALLPEHTQLRVDSNTDREYCNNCQYVGIFISTRPLVNRIPEYDSDYEEKHDTVILGNLADLQANTGCICCQSIIFALERREDIKGQLKDWEAELCWNGNMFHCILRCREDDETLALRLRLSKLPYELEGSGLSEFPFWRYKRSMDVYKIDMTIIQEWVKSCDRRHGPESQKIAPLLSASKLDWLYLIDLKKQCLVKVDTAQSPRYIALSYVWGSGEMLKTTSENLEKMLQPGALVGSQRMKGPKLARTIVDAMYIARKLGRRFFWTDCICIVQDDEGERTMFLNEMASIYANAYLTIVAAEGSDGNYGIPGIRRCSEPRDTLCSEMRFPGHTLSLEHEGDVAPALYGKGKPWSTRGWTFQESYLSRRVLVFTSIVSFHCQEHTSCEWDLAPHGTGASHFRIGRSVYLHPEIYSYGSSSNDPLADRTSFICNVPKWPDIVHYAKVVGEYSQKSLSFDDDIIYAFTGVMTVLNQSFHSGFHYGLPEVFFDASLLWEPDWRNSTPLQLRKTRKLLLPSWSWVRTKGSIHTWVWKIFAKDFYKDASLGEIYQLKPRVQWWKTRSQGGASRLIKCQHFSNHTSMPPGWIIPTYPNHGREYSHASSRYEEYPYPFPFPESAEAHLPDVEYGPLLRCTANRGWLIKSAEIKEFGHDKIYGTFSLRLSDGSWAGILFDDRSDQSFPQTSDERCEVIGIAEGRFPGLLYDCTLPEIMTLPQIAPEVETIHPICIGYEFYFILWIGWVDGIAYRRGIGRVLKEVWENMELKEIEVTLG
ncbi:heterokaryon incompatibility protein domain-containing protein [Trichoderma sp. SZMC 28012]